ncbi:MAG: AAA family ATPase, partial [Campylobacteraceae bacterium]
MNQKQNRFSRSKNIFIEGDFFDYINLDKSVVAYGKIANSLSKPLKLILFYGKPGSGKTFLLKKIYFDLKKRIPIVFFERPIFNEEIFLKKLFEEIFAMSSPDFNGYEDFLVKYKDHIPSNINNHTVTVLLDEAQLYPSDLIEKIRLMADS